jgi:hypothetical protein
VYAPWAFYMNIWALYDPKLPIWPLIGQPNLNLADDCVCVVRVCVCVYVPCVCVCVPCMCMCQNLTLVCTRHTHTRHTARESRNNSTCHQAPCICISGSCIWHLDLFASALCMMLMSRIRIQHPTLYMHITGFLRAAEEQASFPV